MNARKTLALVIASVAVAGCVHVSEVTGPDGKPALVLRCGTHDERCYEKAGDLCPNGYDILDQASGFAIVPTANHSVIGGSHHTIMVECKSS